MKISHIIRSSCSESAAGHCEMNEMQKQAGGDYGNEISLLRQSPKCHIRAKGMYVLSGDGNWTQTPSGGFDDKPSRSQEAEALKKPTEVWLQAVIHTGAYTYHFETLIWKVCIYPPSGRAKPPEGFLKLDYYIWYISFPPIKPVLQALNLTCIVWGDPTPEVSWLKNERPLASDDHCNLKFEAGKTAYFTISGVSTADSGKYGLVVKNKYGSEISDFTVSVFIPEEEARIATAEAQKGSKSKWAESAGGRARRAARSCLVLRVCK